MTQNQTEIDIESWESGPSWEAALTALASLPDTLDIFCPLTQTDCNPRCVCFTPKRIRGAGTYWAQAAFCNNAMFWEGDK